MRIKWMHAGLHFRADNAQESEWLCQFAEMLKGGKFIFEPTPPASSYMDEHDAVPGFDESLDSSV